MLAPRLPAACDVSVTNVCNAACDFCGFARTKMLVGPRRYVDADAFARALPILQRRGVRHITLQGGEPLAHPDIVRLVSDIASAGMHPAVITNGWFLLRYIEQLATAGLERLIVSIDSADLTLHESNRSLDGLARRIRQGIARARAIGLPVNASVTVSRLVRYDELPDTLRDLGVEGVQFSYPRNEPFGSTSLVYSADSRLVDLLHRRGVCLASNFPGPSQAMAGLFTKPVRRQLTNTQHMIGDRDTVVAAAGTLVQAHLRFAVIWWLACAGGVSKWNDA
jgi:MoaA/NifB/PqqE/SkfB family radical SAM enzyme